VSGTGTLNLAGGLANVTNVSLGTDRAPEVSSTDPGRGLVPFGCSTATGIDAVGLSFNARVASLGSSMIRLDGSTLNVNGDSLVNVNASKAHGMWIVSLLVGSEQMSFASDRRGAEP